MVGRHQSVAITMQSPGDDLVYNKPRVPWMRMWLKYRFRCGDQCGSEKRTRSALCVEIGWLDARGPTSGCLASVGQPADARARHVCGFFHSHLPFGAPLVLVCSVARYISARVGRPRPALRATAA